MNNQFVLTASSVKALEDLAKNIRTARILRGMTQQRMCNLAIIARSTLQEIEKGSPQVAIGNYAKVLEVLGMETHFSRIGLYDKLWLARLAEQLDGRKRASE